MERSTRAVPLSRSLRLAGLLSAAVLLTACSGSGASSAPASASGAASAPASASGAASTAPSAASATIEMWSWNNEGAYPDVHKDAQARFEAANPGITINRTYIAYGDYMTKLKAALAAGSGPCIAQIPWAGEFRDLVNSGQLMPLTDAVKTGFPAFFDPIVKAVTFNNDMWAIPLDVNTLQIAYNKTLFDKLGLSIPKTQSDLQAIVDKLKANGKFGISVGNKDQWSGGDLFFAQVAYADGTNTMLAKADAGQVQWNDPVFLKAANSVAAMVKSGIFAPGANSMAAFVGNQDLFVAQKAGMMYPVGNFVTAGITAKVGSSFEWGLFPFPPPDGSSAAPVATGGIAEMFVVTKSCATPDKAIDFLRDLVNDDGGKALVANDFIPSWKYAIPADKSALYKNMVDAQATAMSRVIYTTKVYTALLNSMQGVMDGSKTGQDLVDSLAAAK